MARLQGIPGVSSLRGASAASSPAPAGSSGPLVIRDAGLFDKVNLRCSQDSETVRKGLSQVIGVGLHTDANSFATSGNRMIVRLGPDEWLLIAENGAAESIVAVLDVPQAGHIAVTDVSDAFGAIIIDGPHSRDVLAKHCALDLHASVFTPGTAQRAMLSRAEAILMCIDDSQFQLIGRASFMPYILGIIKDAAIEYGFEYQPVQD